MVVPSGSGPEWRALPLVVGLAVCHALRESGIAGLRMRWPNDVLVADRKLAGLLLDQFAPGSTVAGIGVNVSNNPAAVDPALANSAVTLAELLPHPPPLPALTRAILVSLRCAIGIVQASGLSSLLPEINDLWGGPREVELDLDGQLRRGSFAGVDAQGRLLLGSGPGAEAFSPHQVRHLKEL
jgi:BirA family biotin operon repressor/biotin-[acetyl-CoA-carboxylase] ligase